MIWASLQASSQSCPFAIVLECNKVEKLEVVMYKSLWLSAVWCLVLLLLLLRSKADLALRMRFNIEQVCSKADLALIDEVQY